MAAFTAGVTDAKNLRSSSEADIVIIDPHAQAESFSVAFFGRIYKPPVMHGHDLKLELCLAISWSPKA